MARKNKLSIVLDNINEILDDARNKMDVATNSAMVAFQRGRIAALVDVKQRINEQLKTDKNVQD